ncbi:LLM class flavin-dependent oxidoreductase [Actinokineospora enzanensis]|uniref:LLM class flavin-dependent oxidoreductase n=1 Tax=Actinokineospora enzanensis TaxID=155975 RepID=UPI0003A8507D|nr:LLM class flavin-dependent oxidoreductase [Actinokineospora enzanensis]
MPADEHTPGVSLGLIEYLDLTGTSDVATRQRVALDSARLADDLGYHRLWIPEHHGLLSPSTNALTMASVVGSHTRHIRVGTAVVLLRIRDPHLTAEEVATAASFCGSRLDIGIGRGDFGGPGAELLDGLRKGDAALTDAMDRLFEVLDNGCEWIPRLGIPAERWLHGTGTGSSELAAERGLSYCHALFLNPDIDTCLDALRRYRSGPRATGRTAIAVAVVANDDTAVAAADACRPPFAVNCAGSVRECARMIRRLVDLTGVDDVLVTEMSAHPPDHFRAIEAIRHAVDPEHARGTVR